MALGPGIRVYAMHLFLPSDSQNRAYHSLLQEGCRRQGCGRLPQRLEYLCCNKRTSSGFWCVSLFTLGLALQVCVSAFGPFGPAMEHRSECVVTADFCVLEALCRDGWWAVHACALLGRAIKCYCCAIHSSLPEQAP